MWSLFVGAIVGSYNPDESRDTVMDEPSKKEEITEDEAILLVKMLDKYEINLENDEYI